ncbi:hypothetical protein F5146DRAFT_143265 [Armillaria mellea]|nr:hypothetical protein F5146DRAFT_143265 [Armillaria mellea]
MNRATSSMSWSWLIPNTCRSWPATVTIKLTASITLAWCSQTLTDAPINEKLLNASLSAVTNCVCLEQRSTLNSKQKAARISSHRGGQTLRTLHIHRCSLSSTTLRY